VCVCVLWGRGGGGGILIPPPLSHTPPSTHICLFVHPLPASPPRPAGTAVALICFRRDIVSASMQFVEAGDYLVQNFPSWSWAAGEPGKTRGHLPKDKQYLQTRDGARVYRLGASTATSSSPPPYPQRLYPSVYTGFLHTIPPQPSRSSVIHLESLLLSPQLLLSLAAAPLISSCSSHLQLLLSPAAAPLISTAAPLLGCRCVSCRSSHLQLVFPQDLLPLSLPFPQQHSMLYTSD